MIRGTNDQGHDQGHDQGDGSPDPLFGLGGWPFQTDKCQSLIGGTVLLIRGRFQAVGDVSHRITPGELAENHADELTPRVIALAVLVRACCPDNSSDGFFGQFADYLGKKCYLCTHKRVWVFFALLR